MSPGVADDPAQIIPESLADLLERPLYAHMATVRPDGTPQVNPTWYRFDGEHVWLTATTYRQKYRNWQHQPATALSITDPDDPSRYLEVRGVVERIIPDPEGAEFVRLAERYGEPQGPPADKAYRIAVAIRPKHTTTQLPVPHAVRGEGRHYRCLSKPACASALTDHREWSHVRPVMTNAARHGLCYR